MLFFHDLAVFHTFVLPVPLLSLIDALISFESPAYVVPENGGPVEVCLMKSAPTAQGFTVQLEARQTQPTEATGKGWEEYSSHTMYMRVFQRNDT